MRRRGKREKSSERQGFSFRARNSAEILTSANVKKCAANAHFLQWAGLFEKDGQKYKIMCCQYCPHREDVVMESKDPKDIQKEIKKESKIDKIIKGFKKKGK